MQTLLSSDPINCFRLLVSSPLFCHEQQIANPFCLPSRHPGQFTSPDTTSPKPLHSTFPRSSPFARIPFASGTHNKLLRMWTTDRDKKFGLGSVGSEGSCHASLTLRHAADCLVMAKLTKTVRSRRTLIAHLVWVAGNHSDHCPATMMAL
jgi:hypothetical protein